MEHKKNWMAMDFLRPKYSIIRRVTKIPEKKKTIALPVKVCTVMPPGSSYKQNKNILSLS